MDKREYTKSNASKERQSLIKREHFMKHVYVVRHCQAEGQASDAQLSTIGAEQSIKLAQFLSDKAISYIVSSPYVRAYSTIKPLSDQLDVPIKLEDRLAERVLIESDHPDWRNMLRNTYDDMELCYEGGESSNTATCRVVSVLQDILSSEHSNIVLVSHGNLVSLLLKYFDQRIGYKEWEGLSNPDVFQLSFAAEEKPTIVRIWSNGDS